MVLEYLFLIGDGWSNKLKRNDGRRDTEVNLMLEEGIEPS